MSANVCSISKLRKPSPYAKKLSTQIKFYNVYQIYLKCRKGRKEKEDIYIIQIASLSICPSACPLFWCQSCLRRWESSKDTKHMLQHVRFLPIKITLSRSLFFAESPPNVTPRDGHGYTLFFTNLLNLKPYVSCFFFLFQPALKSTYHVSF